MTLDEAPRRPSGLLLRPASEEDLPRCAEIWRDALNDYMGRLGLPPMGQDLGAIGRLHAHIRATDPERFRVAERGGRVVGFGAAVVRGRVWFLSMLFVRPGEQRAGIGRALLHEILPPADAGMILATATDSAQPVSNGLYASLGIVPREPLLLLIGLPKRQPLPALPEGLDATPFEDLAGPHNQAGHEELAGAVNALDTAAVGFAHPQDHRMLRADRRHGFLYRDRSGESVGYAYASQVGRVGPIAVRDPELLAAVTGHVLGAVRPNGAFAIWLPGSAASTMTALVRAGFRVDGFPVLVCWSARFADFGRYIPISPGLL